MSWTVRGLLLPAPLISLLQASEWRHPGPVLQKLMPWFSDPLWFMPDLEDMRRQNRAQDQIADDSSISGLFRMGRGNESLPWLDVDRSVLIAVNEHAGDDVALALDYRTSTTDPRVVASDFWTNPRQASWREVTPTFTGFLSALQEGTA